MSTSLSPKQAAKIAQSVYLLKDNTDLTHVKEMSGGLGVQGMFEVGDSSRFEGTSGPLMFKKASGFGFVAPGIGNRSGEAIVSIRGTSTIRDWMTDGNCGLQRGPGGDLVHAGFNDTFNSFKNELDKFFDAHGATKTVHCIGHSLGGALATLSADYLTAKGVNNVKLYTFGCPRVGTSTFTENLTRKVKRDNFYRVYHEADPVSMIPIFPFTHAPTNIKSYQVPWNGWKVSVPAHYMDNYIKSVGSLHWNALPSPIEAEGWADKIDGWLEANPSTLGPAMGSAKLMWMIGKALVWILKKAGLAVGVGVAVGMTIVDRIAWLLTQAAHKSIEMSGYVSRLIAAIFRFLGKPLEVVANVGYAFLRWVMGLFMNTLTSLASRASQAIFG